MTTGTLALIIFGAFLAQVLMLILMGLRRRMRRREAPTIAPAPEPRPRAKSTAEAFPQRDQVPPLWDGFKAFVVQRRVLEDPSGTVCSFYLVPADAKPLPSFNPGQYLTFRLEIGDPKTQTAQPLVRCYSLSDRPGQDYYRVTIKRVPPPPATPDAPPGRSSNYFHDRVQEGMRLSVRAPTGHFYLLDAEPLPVVLIAGGIGITPLLSMLISLLHRGSNREIYLFLGVRNSAEHMMKAELEALPRAHSNFHLHVCYSLPAPADVEGIDYQHQGYMDIALLRATLRLMRHQFYVCGPSPMMETLVPALEAWGVDPVDIHYESFGPASLRKPTLPMAASGAPVQVVFSRSGRSVPWDPAAGSLLQLAEAQRIPVDSGCRAGSCGCCQTRLEAGEVQYSQEPDADIAADHCLLCIATPMGDLTLAL